MSQFKVIGILSKPSQLLLTHWGRVTHICVSELSIISSDNRLSPGRRQAIIWTNDRILLIGPSGTHFSEILFGIQTFSFKKIQLKVSSAKWRPFCLGLNVLRITASLCIRWCVGGLTDSYLLTISRNFQSTWAHTEWSVACGKLSALCARSRYEGRG